MERRFQTKDELEHFDFEDAVLEEVECACGRVKVMIDNVKILPDNSMNRDIRTMRANQMEITFVEGSMAQLEEEGYKVYDADGNLRQTYEDRAMSEQEIQEGLRELSGLTVYEINKADGMYSIVVEGEDHSSRFEIAAEKWTRPQKPTITNTAKKHLGCQTSTSQLSPTCEALVSWETKEPMTMRLPCVQYRPSIS